MVSDTAVRQAIYQKLNVSALTTLLGSGSASLVHGIGQQTSAYPLCSFQKQSGVLDARTFQGKSLANQLWLVKGICRGPSATDAERVDKAAFDLLENQDLTITGAVGLWLARESDVNYDETQGDTKYWHAGGIYRLRYRDT